MEGEHQIAQEGQIMLHPNLTECVCALKGGLARGKVEISPGLPTRPHACLEACVCVSGVLSITTIFVRVKGRMCVLSEQWADS